MKILPFSIFAVKRMKEREVTRLCAIGAVISVFALYLITANISSSGVNIGEIDASFIGETVNVTGEVKRISHSEGNIFMNIGDESGEIKVVLWEDTIKSIDDNYVKNMKEGVTINLIGEVQMYKGELEIIPMRGNVKVA